MKNKEKSSFSRMIMQFMMVIPNIFNIINHVIATIRSEARLTGKYIITLIILAVLFAALMATTWACTLVMLLLYLVTDLHLSWMQASLALFILNFLLLIIVGLMMTNTKNRLFFSNKKHDHSLCKNCRE